MWFCDLHEGPPNLVMFCDLQGEFPKPVTAVLLIVMAHYSERIQITISKGQKSTVQILEETKQKIPVVFFIRITWTHFTSQQHCVITCTKCRQPEKISWTLVSRIFAGDQSYRHAVLVYLTDLSCSVSNSSRSQINTGRLKAAKEQKQAFIIYYTVSINYLMQSRTLGIKFTLFREVFHFISQELVKAQS